MEVPQVNFVGPQRLQAFQQPGLEVISLMRVRLWPELTRGLSFRVHNDAPVPANSVDQGAPRRSRRRTPAQSQSRRARPFETRQAWRCSLIVRARGLVGRLLSALDTVIIESRIKALKGRWRVGELYVGR